MLWLYDEGENAECLCDAVVLLAIHEGLTPALDYQMLRGLLIH